MARDTQVIDATFVHVNTSPGAAGSTTGVGAPFTDKKGLHWKIDTNRVYGVAFTSDGVPDCCYYDSGDILEGAVKLDYESFNMGCLLRFDAALITGYAVGFNGPDGPHYVYKCVANTQTALASAQDFGGGFVLPTNPQIEFQVRDNGAEVLLTVLIRSADTPTVTYALRQYHDTSSPIRGTGRAGIATYFNGVYGGGGATRFQSLSQTVVAASEDRFGIFFLGDSITAGIGTIGGSSLDTGACSHICAIKIFDQGDAFMAFTNGGVAGTTSTNWLPGGGYLDAAVASARARNETIAHVMIGTNDAQVGFLAAATYKSNVQTIVNYLIAQGFTKVILNQPPYNDNPAHSGAEHTLCISLLQQYSTALDQIADATVGVYRGDRSLYAASRDDAFATHYTDGIHPDAYGHTVIATKWATTDQVIRNGATIAQVSAQPGDTISGEFLGGGVATPTAAYLSTDGTLNGAVALGSLSVQSNAGQWTAVIPTTTRPGAYRVVMVSPTIISTGTVSIAYTGNLRTGQFGLLRRGQLSGMY